MVDIKYYIDAEQHLIMVVKHNGLEVSKIDSGNINELLHEVKLYRESKEIINKACDFIITNCSGELSEELYKILTGGEKQ